MSVLKILLLCSFSLYAYGAKIELAFDLNPERQKKIEIEKDGFWSLPVSDSVIRDDLMKTYVFLDGYDKGVQITEKILFEGFSFKSKEVLLPIGGKLSFLNKESFDRVIAIMHEGELYRDDIVITSDIQKTIVLTKPGDYYIYEKLYPNVNMNVKVLAGGSLKRIAPGRSKASFNVTSGSYILKIYSGVKEMYHDDFSVTNKVKLSIAYSIVGRKVKRLDSLSNITSNIMLRNELPKTSKETSLKKKNKVAP